MCVRIIPQEQAGLCVLARPGKENKEGLSLFPNLSVIGTFRRTLTGQRGTPSFALQFSQFTRLGRDPSRARIRSMQNSGERSPKITPVARPGFFYKMIISHRISFRNMPFDR